MSEAIIGVLGGGTCSGEIEQLAEQVGEAIARRNAVLVCGGGGGVMAAACRGAKRAGGTTIGILPGRDASQANPHVDIPIVTGMGDARNIIIVRTAAVVIAIDGEFGTLSEIAFALKLNTPVIGLRTWDVHPDIIEVASALEAVDTAFHVVDESR